MRSAYQSLIGGVVAAISVTLSGAGLAAEPMPGLWQQTMTSDMSGTQMPQMPALPPDVLAQMQAAGIQMPNMNFSQPNTTSSQYCITQEDIANREPFDLGEEMDECMQENLQMSDEGMSVDIVCSGSTTGNGRIEYVFDSPTHYTGNMTFQGSSDGMSTSMNSTIEGTWLAADCGNVE